MNMFESIPDASIVFGIMFAFTFIFALFSIISNAVSNKKEEDYKKVVAKENGETYTDPRGDERVLKFFVGYPIIAALGCFVVSGAVFLVMSTVGTHYCGFLAESAENAVIVGTFVSVILYLFADGKYFHDIADGLFYKVVEAKVVEEFLNGTAASLVDAGKEAVKSAISVQYEKFLAAGMNSDEALAAAQAVLGKK